MEEKKREFKEWEEEIRKDNYRYDIPEEVYSEVKCLLHEIGLTKELPGRDALKEALMFLQATCKKGYSYEDQACYDFALEMALHKVEGRRFETEDGKKAAVCSQEDVEQVMRESLRAADICDISIKEFIYFYI